jgi:choline-sulfatase
VLLEGGPFHVRGELPGYLERLRATGRGELAAALTERYR